MGWDREGESISNPNPSIILHTKPVPKCIKFKELHPVYIWKTQTNPFILQ